MVHRVSTPTETVESTNKFTSNFQVDFEFVFQILGGDMFTNPRYLTKGINEELPLNLQILLWSMIDTLLIEKDYLQVFNIKVIRGSLLGITHNQEQPEYKQTIQAVGEIERDMKIFVIDDGEQSTMLFAEEY